VQTAYASQKETVPQSSQHAQPQKTNAMETAGQTPPKTVSTVLGPLQFAASTVHVSETPQNVLFRP